MVQCHKILNDLVELQGLCTHEDKIPNVSQRSTHTNQSCDAVVLYIVSWGPMHNIGAQDFSMPWCLAKGRLVVSGRADHSLKHADTVSSINSMADTFPNCSAAGITVICFAHKRKPTKIEIAEIPNFRINA